MTVSAPVSGVRTPYARFTGDALGWLSVAGLLVSAAMVVGRRRRAGRPPTPVADERELAVSRGR